MKKIINFLKKLADFYVKVVTTFLQFCAKVYISFIYDNGFIMASSLVYSTLISLVPFLAFIFSLFSIFGIFDQLGQNIKNFLTTNIFPSRLQNIISYIEGFRQNAQTLGTIGLISFLVTSIFLLNRIWGAFNKIYKCNSHKPIVSQFAGYVTNIIFGTLLLGVSISITSAMHTNISGLLNIQIPRNILLFSLPWILLFVTIFLMIKTIPSTKVAFLPALIATTTATIAWAVLNNIFMWTIDTIITLSVIYGSIGSIILFLIWIYSAWLIILFSVEIAYILQYNPSTPNLRVINNPPGFQLSIAINIMLELSRNFRNAKGPMTLNQISRSLFISDIVIYPYIVEMKNKKLILEISGITLSYVPGKALDQIHLTEIIQIFSTYSQTVNIKNPEVNGIIQKFFTDGCSNFEGITITEILDNEKDFLHQGTSNN